MCLVIVIWIGKVSYNESEGFAKMKTTERLSCSLHIKLGNHWLSLMFGPTVTNDSWAEPGLQTIARLAGIPSIS